MSAEDFNNPNLQAPEQQEDTTTATTSGGDDSSNPFTSSRKSRLQALQQRITQKYQQLEDRIVPFKVGRWAAFGFSLFLYLLRVFVFTGGFYIVTYTLFIHLLYCLVVLITPLSDPEGDDGLDGAGLPGQGKLASSSGSSSPGSEHKPFIPKVAEFKIWRSMFRVVLIAFLCTFFSVFDLPVFWPILLLYFVLLFVTQMAGRIQHMLRHKYVPWNANKPKFVAKDDK